MAAINAEGLQRAMELANYSPSKLATTVGISRTYMADILAGRRKLKRNPELVGRIALALNVPVPWITTRPLDIQSTEAS